MAHYEVVGVKMARAGNDYQSAESLASAKSLLKRMIEQHLYTRIFIRQYRKDMLRGEIFRVLHQLSWYAEPGFPYD